MGEFWDFAKVYARSFRKSGEIILFLVGLIAFLLSFTIQLAGIVSVIVFGALLIVAAKQAWSSERAARLAIEQELAAIKDSSVTFDKLDPIQQEILRAIEGLDEKRLVVLSTLGGPMYLGLETIVDKYDPMRIDSEIADLVEKGILKFAGNIGKNGNHSVYKPTKLFFSIVDGLALAKRI